VAAIDAQLGGGWRRGEVSEILGPRSSGRTSVLLATMAAATTRGEIVGLVDATDRFDPASALEAGVDLDRVLWVRGPARTVEFERKPHRLTSPIRRGRVRGPDSVESSLIQRAVRAFDLILAPATSASWRSTSRMCDARRADAAVDDLMRLAHANEGTKPWRCWWARDAWARARGTSSSCRRRARGRLDAQSRTQRLDLRHREAPSVARALSADGARGGAPALKDDSPEA
jgi:hypothetical protein